MDGMLKKCVSVILLVTTLLVPQFLFAKEDTEFRQLYMPNGQVFSNLVRIYVNGDIKPGMKPCLRILSMNAAQAANQYYPVECDNLRQQAGFPQNKEDEYPNYFLPVEVAPNTPIESKGVTHTGTLMLFNLSSLDPPWYSTGQRFRPVVYWVVDDQWQLAIGAREVHIGSEFNSMFLAILIVLTILFALWVSVGKKSKNWRLLNFVSDRSGHLMLPLVQMAIWTIAIGGVVLAFALIGLEHTQLPESLVALMGLSAVTGVAGHWQYKRLNGDEIEAKQDKASALYSLVCIRMADNKLFPSLAKAQMLFWTLITVGIFVYKSVTEGALWVVPNELVMLMGISQAGYLGREQLEVGKKANTSSESQPPK